MPLVKPPQQSARAKELFASLASKAAAASAMAAPSLYAMVDFCAANATDSSGVAEDLFAPPKCPGLADLTANGTAAPWPSSAQIVQRFVDELLALEYGHGFGPLWSPDAYGCVPGPCMTDPALVLNPLLPAVPNMFHPLTLDWNSTPYGDASTLALIQSTVFPLDAFKNGGQNTTLNFTDAANRITSCTATPVRGPGPNMLGALGPVNVVMRPAYVRQMMLLTPSDSWHCESHSPHHSSVRPSVIICLEMLLRAAKRGSVAGAHARAFGFRWLSLQKQSLLCHSTVLASTSHYARLCCVADLLNECTTKESRASSNHLLSAQPRNKSSPARRRRWSRRRPRWQHADDCDGDDAATPDDSRPNYVPRLPELAQLHRGHPGPPAAHPAGVDDRRRAAAVPELAVAHHLRGADAVRRRRCRLYSSWIKLYSSWIEL
jgi:hypothetical protein